MASPSNSRVASRRMASKPEVTNRVEETNSVLIASESQATISFEKNSTRSSITITESDLSVISKNFTVFDRIQEPRFIGLFSPYEDPMTGEWKMQCDLCKEGICWRKYSTIMNHIRSQKHITISSC